MVWLCFFANVGGDMAAQDAWAAFARLHPGSAYDLAWYGGIHPVSYSVLSPYVMAALGPRTSMVLASTAAAGLLGWLLTRAMDTPRQKPSIVIASALAFFGNTLSGRVTFVLGITVALLAICVVVSGWNDTAATRTRRPRSAVMTVILAATATGFSPLAGLFLGLIATGLWFAKRRTIACQLGVPPLAVVIVSTLLFPSSGIQPMSWTSTILPVTIAIAVMLLTGREWHLARLVAAIYAATVLAVWLIPTPIGTNIERLGLLFAGGLLAASAFSIAHRTSWLARHAGRTVASVTAVAAVLLSAGWQIAVAATDAAHDHPPANLAAGVPSLVDELYAHHADLGRVEAVPTRSHWEQTALAAYFPLARGWNRQADEARNPLFYRSAPLTSNDYRAWLDQWAVRYVVIGNAPPDLGAAAETNLVRSGLPYLTTVWSGHGWRLYAVRHPKPLISAPAHVVTFNAAKLVVDAPRPGHYLVRVTASPWLSLIDANGKPLQGHPTTGGTELPACLDVTDPAPNAPQDRQAQPSWVILRVRSPGTYRIGAPYRVGSGTSCAK